ncbi:MAG: hypothetical protein GHCLOJNM_02394 [bacterium]|nr:hypothetical protein [bacterium]
MIVDINSYFGTWPYWAMEGTDVGSVLRNMDRCGIDKAFVCSLRGVFMDPAEGNAETLAAVERHADRLLPALTYSPYASGRDRYAEELSACPARMVKLFPLNHSYDPLEEPFIEELLNWCGEHRVPVLIPHRLVMSWRFPTFPVAKIGALAEKHPNATFILGSINYLFELQSASDVLRRRPNTLVETSAMMAFEEIRKVSEEIGAHRLLHGSCNPLQIPAVGPLKVRTAEIPEEQKERILWRNAGEIFDFAGQEGIPK